MPCETSGIRTLAVGDRCGRPQQCLAPKLLAQADASSAPTAVRPPQYTTVLAACQDRARGVPFEAARQAVEAELGASLEELFDDFESHPIAAASIAQVHSATVRGGGERVAVKVAHSHLAPSYLCVSTSPQSFPPPIPPIHSPYPIPAPNPRPRP